MAYTTWLILGFICLIGEIFTVDFTLSCIGLSAFIAGLFAYLGLGATWQLAAMGVSMLILFGTLRPFALKYLYKNKQPAKSGIDALIGKTFKVVESKEGKAYIKSDADTWEVKAEEPLKEGDNVEVKKVEGITLIVTKK